MTTITLAARPSRRHWIGRRPQRSLGLVAAAVLTCLLGLEPIAVASPTAPVGDDPAAVRLLTRAAAAAAEVSYTGAQTVTVFAPSGTVTAMVRLTHVAGVGTVVQPAGSAYRPVTSAYMPVADTGATLDHTSLAALVGAYDVTLSGTPAWPVGRRSQVVVVRRTDGGIAARLWVDDATGLLLRRQIYDHAGQLVRASSFTELRLGHVPQLPGSDTDVVTLAAAPQAGATASTAAETTVSAAQARATGWQIPGQLAAGTELIGSSLAGSGSVLHLVYTDGLTTTSVFEQRGRLDPSQLDADAAVLAGRSVYVHAGLPSYAVWSCDGITYTVVGDTPDELASAVAALPHAADRQGGLLERVGRGMHRLYGMLDPLD